MASDVSFGAHNGFVPASPHRALLARQRALRACVWGLWCQGRVPLCCLVRMFAQFRQIQIPV
eukprot:1444978-Prymnesium_polylepis.1